MLNNTKLDNSMKRNTDKYYFRFFDRCDIELQLHKSESKSHLKIL